MIRPFPLAIVFALAGAACGERASEPGPAPADRVLLNGAVHTMDAGRRVAEAVAIRAGRIVFVGSTEDARAQIGAGTEVDDLEGRMLLPGFHDSHTHILIGVATEADCDLLRIPTRAEVIARLEECRTLEGYGAEGWILGGGWGEWLFGVTGPRKETLDGIFGDRPVYLASSFGHSAWVNSRALELAGIHGETVAGEDGVIVRDPATGEATGTLHESAMALVTSIVPEKSLAERIDSVRAAIEMAHSLGVTAVIEPGVDGTVMEPILALADAGEFDLRARLSLSPIAWQPGAFDDDVFAFLEGRAAWRRPNLDVDSVKIYMDGVIEYGTGALLEPYTDDTFGLGPRFYTQEKLDEYFTRFDAMGLGIHVHAIGDAAVRMALDAFETMRGKNGVSDNRHHMTHLQLIDEADIPRFGELGIGATFQALWAYPDPAAMELDLPILGEERTYRMYPIASVAASGGRVTGASDYWVTDMDPLLAIEVGVTRQDPYADSGPVLNEGERVDLDTMLAAYTINGAWTMGLEAEQGSIEIGKRADLVVLDRDLTAGDAYGISDAKVTMTIFDGRTVYRRTD
ncbi:MAG: amidohydrolase [Woeseiaceae bacterium]|nr:amidohydrolase [Woeseiaceae bacterium]